MSKAQTAKALPVSSLKYRPRDYFARYDLQAELLTHVKGRARREMIKDALEIGAICPTSACVRQIGVLD